MIERLMKVTLIASQEAKPEMLRQLQALGTVHLIDLSGNGKKTIGEGPGGDALRAIQFLKGAPHRRRQMHHDTDFDAKAFVEKLLFLKTELKTRIDERDRLKQRIMDVRPWGNVEFPTPEHLKGYRIWFYKVPVNRYKALLTCGLPFKQVNKDHKFHYVLIVSATKPHHLPFIRSHVGRIPLEQLEARLEALDNLIEDLETERIRMTRYIDALNSSLIRLDDHAKLLQADEMGWEHKKLCVFQGWTSTSDVKALQNVCAERRWVLTLTTPDATESPPTLIRNHPFFSFGKSLLTFYTTPSYWQSDPSSVFFVSFALFFAIILGDAGYAALLGVGVLMYGDWLRRNDQSRAFGTLLKVLTAATFVWGMLIGSYFGMVPDEGSWLQAVHLLDVNDYEAMMRLSIAIGALHVITANVIGARDRQKTGRRGEALVAVGWAIGVAGALMAYLVPAAQTVGMSVVGIAMAVVIVFSGSGETRWRRLGSAFLSVMKVTSIFGDILSYLRLFALGLATSAMAVAFNQLALNVMDQMPGVGVLMALLVLLIGHTLNFILGIMSGVVHGLRLNVIEYLNWNAQGEGYPFIHFDHSVESDRS